MIELFITVPEGLNYLHASLVNTLRHNRVLANIEAIESTVKDKKTYMIRLEHGYKVTILNDIDDNTLINIWFDIRNNTVVHCIWVNSDSFNGCITKHPYYLKNWQYYDSKLLSCSEY